LKGRKSAASIGMVAHWLHHCREPNGGRIADRPCNLDAAINYRAFGGRRSTLWLFLDVRKITFYSYGIWHQN
jgi:hypothetical protein